MAKKTRVHREYFRAVDRGGRTTCPHCSAPLAEGERIWSLGEYVRIKFRHRRDVCKACWPALAAELAAHVTGCGCAVELVTMKSPRPAWLPAELTPAACPVSA